jgi:hypothetical protein
LIPDRNKNILLFTAFTLTPKYMQISAEWIPEALSSRIKWSGREADHSLHSIDDVKKCSYSSTPSIRLHGMMLS